MKNIQKHLSSSVLIIDDSKLSREIVAKILRSYGINNLIHAEDGQDGLDLTLKYRPDIVIADLIMPRMNGHEYCQEVRKHPDFKNTPIIIQTAAEEFKRRKEIFNSGATDMLPKPIHPDELIARTVVHLEKQSLIEDMKVHNERMQSELMNAQTMQYELMPSEAEMTKIRKYFPFNMDAHFDGSYELSGDLWGFKTINHHQMAIYIVDFTGHGMKAALNTFRLHTMMHSEFAPTTDPGSYLTKLNARLYSMLERGQLATMFYGVIDSDANEITYATASATSPIILKSSGHGIDVIDGRGLPLGVFSNIKYETKTIPFEYGDTLLLYSDALIESQDREGNFFNEDDLVNYCHSLKEDKYVDGTNTNPEQVCTKIINRIYEHHGGARMDDDVTLIALSYQDKL